MTRAPGAAAAAAGTSLIIFAKAPVAGQVKTRLMPALGAAGAAELAARLLEHTVAAAMSAGFQAVELCTAPDASHPAFARLAARHPGLQLGVQDASAGADLGARMHHALTRRLAGGGRVLLIGTDAPALDAAMLREAAQALAGHDAVFVPAHDGGYALVGLTRPQPALFTGMAWSTPQVMAQTRDRAARAGLRWAELPAVADIDEPADLVHLPAGLAAMKRLVLAGAGHAHAQVLLEWAQAPLPGVEIVVVSPQAWAPYSGMVPGWLAGTYRFEQIAIDFPALCRNAGARWVEGEIHAVDAARRRLRFSSGEELDYALLSLNVGSTLTPPAEGPGSMLSMRPLSQLRPAYEALLARWVADPGDRPITVTAVGGGAAGFESLLAVRAQLRALRPDRVVHCGLVTRGTTLIPGLSRPARRAALQALHRAGVTLQLGTAWCDTIARSSELVLWATGAEAHAWQRDPDRRGGLAVSPQGFVRIDAQLRSVSHAQVFAAGDCAEWATPLPKAGVYAVRMAPVLAHNLRAALGHGEMRAYRPQSRYLVLLSTGDGRAIASRGALGGQGRWAWRWKDHIDRRFVARYAAAAEAAGDDAGVGRAAKGGGDA